MKLVYGYLAATSTTQHGGVKVTFPLAFSSTKYQCILGLHTNNSGGGIDFQDTGYTSKAKTTITIRSENTGYMAGTSYLCIGY